MVASWLVPLLLFLAASPDTESGRGGVDIELVNGSEAEIQVREELRAILDKYDLEPWLFTNSVRVEANVIPHSHPVLTLHTRHRGNESALLAVFLHEQLHWYASVEGQHAAMAAAVASLEAWYPDVPGPDNGGARDTSSTYRHLIINYLEFNALCRVLGRERAEAVLAGKSYYRWIYRRVREDSARLATLLDDEGLLERRCVDGGRKNDAKGIPMNEEGRP